MIKFIVKLIIKKMFYLDDKFLKEVIERGLCSEIEENIRGLIPENVKVIDFDIFKNLKNTYGINVLNKKFKIKNEFYLSQIPSDKIVIIHDFVDLPENIKNVIWRNDKLPNFQQVEELTLNSFFFNKKHELVLPSSLRKLSIGNTEYNVNLFTNFNDKTFEKLVNLEEFEYCSKYFDGIITNLPKSLKKLKLTEMESTKIEIDDLPNLEELVVPYGVNISFFKGKNLGIYGEIENGFKILETVENLHFVCKKRTNKIFTVQFTKNLKTLSIRGIKINLDNLPNIETLKIYDCNVSLDFLPVSLKYLFVCGHNNLDNLPPNIKKLSLMLENVNTLPDSVQDLYISEDINKLVLPKSLKKLDLSSCLYPINNLPDNLNHLVVNGDYLHCIRKFPKNLKILEIQCGDIRISLPNLKIEELILNNYYQEIKNIPETVKLIRMKDSSYFYHPKIKVVYE